jgi:hypothetical protein
MTERTHATLKLSIVILAFLAAGFALLASWDSPTSVHAQQTTTPIITTTPSSPSPAPASPAPTTTATSSPTPAPVDDDLFNAGGPAEGPVPPIPGDGCPSEYPVLKDGACYSGDRGE